MKLYDNNKRGKSIATLALYAGKDVNGNYALIDKGCLFYNKHGYLTVKVENSYYNIVPKENLEEAA